MFLSVLAGLTGLWAARAAAHTLILKGLRAPRVAADTSPEVLGLSALPVHLPGPNGKTLFAWFVPVPGVLNAPAILVMHGWGANASMMLPSVAPLLGAGFAVIGAQFDEIAPVHSMTRVLCPVLLVHGEDDDTVPFDDARRLLAAGGARARCNCWLWRVGMTPARPCKSNSRYCWRF